MRHVYLDCVLPLPSCSSTCVDTSKLYFTLTRYIPSLFQENYFVITYSMLTSMNINIIVIPILLIIQFLEDKFLPEIQ